MILLVPHIIVEPILIYSVSSLRFESICLCIILCNSIRLRSGTRTYFLLQLFSCRFAVVFGIVVLLHDPISDKL